MWCNAYPSGFCFDKDLTEKKRRPPVNLFCGRKPVGAVVPGHMTCKSCLQGTFYLTRLRPVEVVFPGGF